MPIRIGHASIDENRKARGGAAGDQTGKEVKISDWYLHAKGWVVLRCKDTDKRERIAAAMERACANPSIGYDQNQRNTLFAAVRDQGYDPGKAAQKCETDCSALVRVCIAAAYGRDLAGDIRTATLPGTLTATGQFEKLTADKYCASSDCLLRGDILCTPVSGHTVVVLDDGAKAGGNTAPIKGFTVALPTLRKGDEGSVVCALQALLIGCGYDCGRSGADGKFGSATDTALRKYQSRHSLTTDGIAGPGTWAALLGVCA